MCILIRIIAVLFLFSSFPSLAYFDIEHGDYLLTIEGHVESLRLDGTPKIFSESHLLVFNKKTKTIETLLTKECPSTMKRFGDFLYMVCPQKNMLYKLSLKNEPIVTAKLNLPQPLKGFVPTGLAIFDDQLFIFSEDYDTTHIVDIPTFTHTRIVPWGPVQEMHVFEGTGYLYHPNHNHITTIDLKSYDECGQINLKPFPNHQSILFHRAAAFLYRHDGEETGEVVYVDLKSKRLVQKVPAPQNGNLYIKGAGVWCGDYQIGMVYPECEIFAHLTPKDYEGYFAPVLSELRIESSGPILSPRQAIAIDIYLERNESAFLNMGEEYHHQQLKRYTPHERIHFALGIKDKSFLNSAVWLSILKDTHQQALQDLWRGHEVPAIKPLLILLEKLNSQDDLVIAYKRACRTEKIIDLLEKDTYHHFLGGQYINWERLKQIVPLDTQEGKTWCHAHGPFDVLPLFICLEGETPEASKITAMNEMIRQGILHKHPFLTSLAHLAFAEGLWGAEKDSAKANALAHYTDQNEAALFNENVLAYRIAMNGNIIPN